MERPVARGRILELARPDIARRYDELFVTDRSPTISTGSLDNAYIDALYKHSGDRSLYYYRLYEHFEYDFSAVIDSLNASAVHPDNPRDFIELLMAVEIFALAGTDRHGE